MVYGIVDVNPVEYSISPTRMLWSVFGIADVKSLLLVVGPNVVLWLHFARTFRGNDVQSSTNTQILIVSV